MPVTIAGLTHMLNPATKHEGIYVIWPEHAENNTVGLESYEPYTVQRINHWVHGHAHVQNPTTFYKR